MTEQRRGMMRALGSLTNRIFLASALLASVSIGAGVYFVSNRLRSEAEIELERDLVEAGKLVEQERTALLESFLVTAQLIADLPLLKAALDTRDATTVQPITDRYRAMAGCDLLALTDRAGTVLGSSGLGDAFDNEMPRAPGVRRALSGETALAYWAHPGGVMQFVSVPVVLDTELLGSLTVGYLLDDKRAVAFKELTGADIAFALDGQIRASTLDHRFHEQLAPLVGAGRVPRLEIADIEYTALVKSLPPPPGLRLNSAAGSEPPKALVLRSRTERMRTLSDIQTGLAVVAVATVLLAVAVSFGVATTITRPLATITNHMRELAVTGDLTQKIPVSRTRKWHDEDARLLATTFNTLTDSVARFQREAAQRERLSSLGRMSTVIAHEVRNPLMIIKGALRQLLREGAAPADIREAAADIDGEIERLNGVVNGVLDFARPIRFDFAPTDVNLLCNSAAQAVVAEHPYPEVDVYLASAMPTINTDSERLRTVLVNLLTNARHAVTAKNGDGGGAPVMLTTARAGERRVSIVVEDQGVGISKEDLPHIFDPYFTTRRGGTGIGLPIVKNIVDGLGGTLSVQSIVNHGTRITIELGDASPAPRPS
jgi:signal transduction histidine kinase